jgi:hypothetical protein
MKLFKITDKIEAVCEHKKTRTAFKHEATLIKDGVTYETVKICYQNRTWESYEFQSVLRKLFRDTENLTEQEKLDCAAWANQSHTDWSGFHATAMVASLGEIFCDTKKEQNDWKLRMIKAGLGSQGLMIPEDWDTLDEDQKQSRLDQIVKLIKDIPQDKEART